jgi:hypothetical protein
MLPILISYLAVNFCVGFLLIDHYLWVERRIASYWEFLVLLFFPVIGWGEWRYNRLVRSNETPELPKRWFVLKYLIRIHWLCFLGLVVLGLQVFLGVNSWQSSASEALGHYDSPLASLAGIFAGLGILFALCFTVAVLVVVLLFCAIVLVLIPIIYKKTIERQTYKRLYEQAKNEN